MCLQIVLKCVALYYTRLIRQARILHLSQSYQCITQTNESKTKIENEKGAASCWLDGWQAQVPRRTRSVETMNHHRTIQSKKE